MIPAVLVLASNGIQVSVDTSLIFDTVLTASGTTSDSATVSAVGGSGSYTYTWSRVSGSAYISPTSTSAATTTFTWSFPFDGFFSTVFKCVVDDGSTTQSVFVTVSITYAGS